MLLRKGNALILLATFVALLILSTLYSYLFPSSSAAALSLSSPPSHELDLSSDLTTPPHPPPPTNDGAPRNDRVHILPIDLGRPKDVPPPKENPDDVILLSPDAPSSHPPSPPPAPPLPPLPAHPLLASRLASFLSRPMLTHDQALAHNIAKCPLAIHERQVNPDQLKGERDGWAKVGVEEIRKRRKGLVKGLRGVEKAGGGEGYWTGKGVGKGRGVVVAGGNQDTTARLLTLLRILRRHKSTLPVEVFHFPGEITSESEREEIRSLGGTLKEFVGAAKEQGVWKNFQIKALSILQSSFAEVLYLDSDNIPIRDPVELFDSPAYLEGGRAVFWPDLNKDHPENAIFRVLGEECNHDEWQIDSGQIVIDKRGNSGLNLAALHLAAHMQKDHDFWFSLSGGDKDTFRYAFHILDLPFSTPITWLASLGTLNPYDNNRFCGHSMVQFSLPPTSPSSPLFIHSNLLKHSGPLPHPGSFTHLKSLRPSIRTNAHGAREGLDAARGWVYDGPGRGMCVDLEVVEDEEVGKGKKGGGGGGAEVVLREWKDVKGGWEGLEEAFWEAGGKVGGW